MHEADLKVGYVMNSYPMTSTTFIVTEILNLEKLGWSITRFATKPWSMDLVSDLDKHERTITRYLLAGNVPNLLLTSLVFLVTRPVALMRGVREMRRVSRVAEKSFVHHVGYLLQAAFLVRACEARGIRHLHAHFGTNSTTICLLAATMSGLTYSFMVHGPDELETVSATEYRLKAQGARAVLAITHYCRSVLLRKVGFDLAEKILVHRCAVDLDTLQPSRNPMNKRFVCVGRLCPQKAQVLILEGLKTLTDRHDRQIDLTIEFIGDGESRTEVEDTIAKYDLGAWVELSGWRSPDEVEAALKNSMAFLLPSFAEGLPVSIMEAMAVSRPVISTYIAGIPELLDADAGWIIPAGTSDAIADALDACLSADAETLAQMGQVGRSRIEMQHDIKAQVAHLGSVFETIVQQSTKNA